MKRVLFDSLPAGDARRQFHTGELLAGESIVVEVLPEPFEAFNLADLNSDDLPGPATVRAHYARSVEYPGQKSSGPFPVFGFAVMVDNEPAVLWTSARSLARDLDSAGCYLLQVRGEKRDRRYIVEKTK